MNHWKNGLRIALLIVLICFARTGFSQIVPLTTTTCPPYAITNQRILSNPNNTQHDLLKERAWAKHPVPDGAADSTQTDLVLLVAHRGIWEFCPENTLEAYEVAADTGADGIEMDLRPSAAGTDAAGVNWPNGEMFLTHDYDLRGEAPGGDSSFDQNNIYYATPAQIEGRPMVDRQGNLAYDSAGSPILFHTLKDNLQQVWVRAKELYNSGVDDAIDFTQAGGNTSTCNHQPPFPAVARGPFLVLDIKGDEGPSPWINQTLGAKNNRTGAAPNGGAVPGDGTWVAIVEAMSEVHAFEVANCIDLERAVVYKIKYGKVRANAADTVPANVPGTITNWADLVADTYPDTPQVGGKSPWPTKPGLIAITYPDDMSKPLDNVRLFEQYSGYWMTNWNVRYRGIRTESCTYADGTAGCAYADLAAGKGNSGFASTNVFPEGTRKSDGSCCDNQPFATFNLSAFDFLFQPAGAQLRQPATADATILTQAAPVPQVRATLQTIDALDNSLSYLQQIGLRNLTHIQ